MKHFISIVLFILVLFALAFSIVSAGPCPSEGCHPHTTPAPVIMCYKAPCIYPTGLQHKVMEAAITVDDLGIVNNPTVNSRANSCYEPGQVCATEQDWIVGYYLIRQQYGMI